MEARIGLIIKSISRISYVLGSICLLAGLILSYVNIPASAAELSVQEDTEETACTPPPGWEDTLRFNRNLLSKEYPIVVAEPQMDVDLEFFWYQDYDVEGCPFDCVNTDECQTYETGDVVSPFGSFSVEDGKEGADGGSKTLSGVLDEGTHKATFTFTGRKGSINLGLRIRTESSVIETSTPTPTDLPPVEETPTPTAILTDTPTPTGTETPVSPGLTDTPTPTQTQTVTGTSVVNPPVPSPTPTEVEKTPPPTLSPPKPPPGATKTPAIIPVTGLDLVYSNPQSFLSQNQFLNLGIGFLGLGLVFHGISRKFNKR